MDFPILYHKTKLGKTVSWHIWTEEDQIITEYGEIDGKHQRACKLATPKNVGKTNETSASEQAILEATSMHKHRLDRKYSLSEETAQETVVFLPMLASDFEKQKTKVKYPVYVQPKFDGVRCMAAWDDEGIKLISRGGKFYNIPHIEEVLQGILPLDYVLDGELYVHGESLQGINKLVKKFRPGPEGTAKIQYHVYDGFYSTLEDVPFLERKVPLEELIGNNTQFVLPVKTEIADSEEAVYKAMGDFMSEGYEGAIVRKLDGKYELGHRSRDLLKVKTFTDAEFLVVGHEFGVGRAHKSVTWICIQEEGLTFKVVPKGTIEQREAWGATAKDYYGKKLTVKFWNRTEDNIPQFPVGVCFRLNEDLPK